MGRVGCAGKITRGYRLSGVAGPGLLTELVVFIQLAQKMASGLLST